MESEKENIPEDFTELIIDDYEERKGNYKIDILTSIQCMICLILSAAMCGILIVYPAVRGVIADMFEDIPISITKNIIKETFLDIKRIIGS